MSIGWLAGSQGSWRWARGALAAGALVLGVAALPGCGGGGGDGPTTRAPLPELAQDVLPAGDRIDRRTENYFPGQGGDQWTYDRLQAGTATGMQHVRTAAAAGGGDLQLSESRPGGYETLVYRRTAEGLVLVDPFAGTGLDGLQRAMPLMLEYPEPFYPVGATRRIVRQGSLGIDLDGDGTTDSYRFEYTQVFVGFETVVLPTGRIDNCAHFRNVTAMTVQPSDLDLGSVSATGTEDTWWAPGIGMVQGAYSMVDETGQAVEPAYTLVLRSATVNGRPVTLAQPDGTVRKVTLVHTALVFDRTRAVYYASVPGSVPLQGNRIATIDAASGAVAYSGAVGSEPAALAVAADGSALYVGLDGSGEVAKLALPGMTEQWRTRLPAPAFYGQLRAESITVSPADADVVAVSTYRVGISPRHGGVALIRAGVLQPRMTQDHTGANLVVLDAAGAFVYGYNTESSEYGLRRIAVVADGLLEELVVTATAGAGSTAIDRIPGGVLFGRAVHDTPGLAMRASAPADGGACRWHEASTRIVCRTSWGGGNDRSITVIDASTMAALATPVYQREYAYDDFREIVPGPRGQVALRFNAGAEQIWLFTTPALP